MKTIIGSPEIVDHLNAALALSQKEVFIRLLNTAQELLQSNQPAAAVLVAGVVLDSMPHKGECATVWRDLRDRLAHPTESRLTIDQAREMITGVRRMLSDEPFVAPNSIAAPTSAANASSGIRGKYAFIATTSQEFMTRKREDMGLEDLQ